MVIPLGPGKFYGSSLPRPRFLKDDADRVSPPVPVLDPLLSWADEAHWSMGGLSFQRLRLQGRIEGSVEKLRAEREKSIRAKGKISKTKRTASDLKASKPQVNDSRKRAGSVSPPPAPVARKRKRYMALVDDSEEEEEEQEDEGERKGKESEAWGEEMACEEALRGVRSRRVEDVIERSWRRALARKNRGRRAAARREKGFSKIGEGHGDEVPAVPPRSKLLRD
ncbi:uncharacterized protein J3R85_004262 [Psidium guajava]|nr:uncharacterized protein J3R85_004262 [Psidium guajava]